MSDTKFLNDLAQQFRLFLNANESVSVVCNIVVVLVTLRRQQVEPNLNFSRYSDFQLYVAEKFPRIPQLNCSKSMLGEIGFKASLKDTDLTDTEIASALTSWISTLLNDWNKTDFTPAYLAKYWLEDQVSNRPVTCLSFDELSVNTFSYLSGQGFKVNHQKSPLTPFDSLLNYLTGVDSIPFTIGDKIVSGGSGICFPGLGGRLHLAGSQYRSSEVAGMSELLNSIEGPVLSFVSQGFLFRTTGEDIEFKRRVIKGGRLACVILLNNHIVSNARINTAVLLFSKVNRPTYEVLMVDASSMDLTETSCQRIVDTIHSWSKTDIEDWTKFVDYEEIVSNGYNLDPKRYVLDEDQKKYQRLIKNNPTIELGEICDIIRSQTVSSSENGNFLIKEVNVSDINEIGFVESPNRERLVDDPSLDPRGKIAKQMLKENDIVFAIKGFQGSVARVGLVKAIPSEEHWVAGQSFVILRLKKNSIITEPIYLFRFLKSDLIQGSLRRLASGQMSQSIKSEDLKNFLIMLPDDERSEALSVTAQKKQEDCYRKIQEYRDEMMTHQSDPWLT